MVTRPIFGAGPLPSVQQIMDNLHQNIRQKIQRAGELLNDNAHKNEAAQQITQLVQVVNTSIMQLKENAQTTVAGIPREFYGDITNTGSQLQTDASSIRALALTKGVSNCDGPCDQLRDAGIQLFNVPNDVAPSMIPDIWERDISLISLSAISAIPPIDINTFSTISVSDLYCTVPADIRSVLFDDACQCIKVPACTQIKQALKGAVVAPWVRVSFVQGQGKDEKELTVVGVGNTSQMGDDGFCPADPLYDPQDCEDFSLLCDACCTAAVKSFQYGWGAIHSGNAVKVTIVDERAGEFSSWINRLFQNPTTASSPTMSGVYGMRITWGWITRGDEGCEHEGGTIARRWYSSIPCWFMPMNVQVSLQNGKFVYEIEALDPMQRGQENALANVHGSDNQKKTFKRAVIDLSHVSQPPFNVYFLARNPGPVGNCGDPLTGEEPQPMKFYIPPNSEGNEDEGPKSVWRCNEQPPLTALSNWLQQVRAKGPNGEPRGITMNYDPTYEDHSQTHPDPLHPVKGRLLLWTNDLPLCQQELDNEGDSRILAGYIVHGGSYSPVLSFQPNIKFNMQVAAQAGGFMGPQFGQIFKQDSDCQPIGQTAPPGRGDRNAPTTQANADQGNSAAMSNAPGTQDHHRANLRHFPIEAELKVQGDPSPSLCTPVLSMFRTLALVVINPYFLHIPDATCNVEGADAAGCCYEWITASACNFILTNKAWFIKGVDHQIREGSYVTTYKLMLSAASGTGPGNCEPVAPVGFDLMPLRDRSDDLLAEQKQALTQGPR